MGMVENIICSVFLPLGVFFMYKFVSLIQNKEHLFKQFIGENETNFGKSSDFANFKLKFFLFLSLFLICMYVFSLQFE